jgi:hypothetical protein
MYKLVHSLDSLVLANYLTFRISNTRSHPHSLHCVQSRVNSFIFSFFVNSAFEWNNLSPDLLNCTSYYAFKSQLTKFFFHHPNSLSCLISCCVSQPLLLCLQIVINYLPYFL